MKTFELGLMLTVKLRCNRNFQILASSIYMQVCIPTVYYSTQIAKFLDNNVYKTKA